MNETIKPKAEWLRFLLYGVFAVVLALYLFSCGKYMWETPAHRILFAPLALAVTGLLFIWGMKKLAEKREYLLQGVLLLVSLAVYGLWGLCARTEPVSDYRILLEGARSVLDGSFPALSFDKTNYFYFYNYQIGYVLYLAGVMKLFGSGIVAVKAMEVLWMALTNLLVYRIGRRMGSPLKGIAAAVIYTFLTFQIAGSSIINNQHVSAFFAALALLLFIDRSSVWSRVGVGLSLAANYILRPSSILFLVGILGFMLFQWLLHRLQDWKGFVRSLLCIGASFGIAVFSLNTAVVSAGLAPGPITKGSATYFKFVLGIQETGLFGTLTESAERTQVYFDLEHLDFDYETYNRLCREYVLDRFCNDTEDTFRYIQEKMEAFTGMPDNQIQYVGEKIANTGIERFMTVVGYEQYLFLLSVSLIGCILRLIPSDFQRERRKEERRECPGLFAVLFLLFWGAHIFIETQTRYRYDQYLLLSLFAAPIVASACEGCWRIIAKRRHGGQLAPKGLEETGEEKEPSTGSQQQSPFGLAQPCAEAADISKKESR